MKYLILVLALMLAVPAMAEPVVKVAGGVNGVWFNGPEGLPSDFEVGGVGRASLSPHISLVGSGFWGLDKGYTVGRAGVRVTATDVDNPNLSLGVGAEYQLSTKPEIRPEEWVYTASLGFRPWPQDKPRVILVGQGFYGVDSQQAGFFAGLRYVLGGIL